MTFEISLQPVSNGVPTPLITVPGLLSASFPFERSPQEKYQGLSLLREPVEVSALQLHFIPGGGRIYRLKLVASRVLELIRRGEWQRLLRAARYRVPQMARSVLNVVSSRS